MQASSAPFGVIVAGNEMVIEHSVSISLPITRKNFSPCPNFESGIGGWFGAGGSGATTAPVCSPSSVRAFSGTQSLKVDLGTGPSTSQFVILDIPNVRPGSYYMISMQVWLDTACPPIFMVNGAATTVSTRGSWQPLQVLLGPNLNTSLLMTTSTATVAGAGVGFWVDVNLIEEVPSTATTPGSYFDGDSPNARWLGPPNLSASVLNVDPYTDLTGAVDSIRIDRQMVTDMPAGTRLIDGSATAQAIITLSGLVDKTDESKTAAWLFGPDEPTSPLYRNDPMRSKTTIDQGLYTGAGAELIRTFTGYIDDVVVDTITGLVTITCLDPFTLMRPEVTIPSIAYLNNYAGYNPGLTGGWVVDFLLRENGIYSSPPPRNRCFFYASMHGSAWPEVIGSPDPNLPQTFGANMSVDLLKDATTGKYIGTPSDYLALMAAGQWSQQVVRNPSITNAPIIDSMKQTNGPNIDQGNTNAGFFFEGWLWADATQDSSTVVSYVQTKTNINGNFLRLKWVWSPGSGTAIAKLDMTRDSGSVVDKAITGTTMTTGAFHQVSCLIRLTASTTATVTYTVDGVTTVTNVTGLPATGGDVNVYYSEFKWRGYADTVQLTTEANPLPLGAFAPTAFLDVSLNPLTAVPDTTGQNPKAVVQALAGAERGIAGFDELGIFRSKNRYTFLAATSSRTITSTSSLKTLMQDTGMSTVATHVQAPATPLTVSAPAVVWQANSVIRVPARQTYTEVVTPNGITLIPQAVDTGYVATSGGGPVGTTYWRAAKKASGTTPVTTGIVVSSYSLSSTTLQLSIRNDNAFDVYMVSPVGLTDVTAGTAYVFIGGVTANSVSGVVGDSQWPPVDEGGASSNPDYGEINLPLPANAWLQDAAAAQTLADDTLIDLYKPRPLMTNTSIVVDPRLQLGDRCTFTDYDGSKMNDDAAIVGSTIADSRTDYSQVVTARRVSSPGEWLMGVAGRSEMAHTTYV